MPKNTSNARFGQVLSEIWPLEVFWSQNSCGRAKKGPGRAQTQAGRATMGPGCMQTQAGCATLGPGRAQTQAGHAQTCPGRVQTCPKSQKTLEGHISLTTCPNRAFEVFFGIYQKCRFQETPQTPHSAKF